MVKKSVSVTKRDLKILEAKLEVRFQAFEDRLDENLKNWKSEIFNLVDDLAEEIRDGREHRKITSYQITGNTRRIEKLEKKVFGVVAEG